MTEIPVVEKTKNPVFEKTDSTSSEEKRESLYRHTASFKNYLIENQKLIDELKNKELENKRLLE